MKFQINVQAMTTNAAGTLKSIRPDSSGIFRKVPVGVIGKPSENNMVYDPESYVKAIVNERSAFRIMLERGGLEGEYFHPMLDTMSEREAMARCMLIDRSLKSHTILSVTAEPTRDGDYYIIYADIKCCGPYGDNLISDFADEHLETAFSMRSWTSEPIRQPNGLFYKKVLRLVTYDAVGAGGFAEASKRGMASMEGLGFTPIDCYSTGGIDIGVLEENGEIMAQLGLESINCQEVLDILQSDTVTTSIHDRPVGIYDHATRSFRTSNKAHPRASMTHAMLKGVL